METTRHIGIDLHRNCFTACIRLEKGRNYVTEWKLEQLPKFVAKLRPSDEVAVEVTGNTRLFHHAVAPHVQRVVTVNPNQFKVITPSVKKTDPNDARNLALDLAKDLLPEVRLKDKTRAQIASLTPTRDTMVKLRTALKNKINHIFSAHGIHLSKESLASERGLRAVRETQFDLLVDLEWKILGEQMRARNKSIAEWEETISRESQLTGRPPESHSTDNGDRSTDQSFKQLHALASFCPGDYSCSAVESLGQICKKPPNLRHASIEYEGGG